MEAQAASQCSGWDVCSVGAELQLEAAPGLQRCNREQSVPLLLHPSTEMMPKNAAVSLRLLKILQDFKIMQRSQAWSMLPHSPVEGLGSLQQDQTQLCTWKCIRQEGIKPGQGQKCLTQTWGIGGGHGGLSLASLAPSIGPGGMDGL